MNDEALLRYSRHIMLDEIESRGSSVCSMPMC